jgi:hypothetical protein
MADYNQLLINELKKHLEIQVVHGVVLMRIGESQDDWWVPLTRQEPLPKLNGSFKLEINIRHTKITVMNGETGKKLFVLHSIYGCSCLRALEGPSFFKVDINSYPGIFDTISGKNFKFPYPTYTRDHIEYYNASLKLIARARKSTMYWKEISHVDGFQQQIYILNGEFVILTTKPEEVKIGENGTVIIGKQSAFSFYFDTYNRIYKLQNSQTQIDLKFLRGYEVEQKRVGEQIICEDYIVSDEPLKFICSRVYKINDVWIVEDRKRGDYKLLNPRKIGSGTKAALAECHVVE